MALFPQDKRTRRERDEDNLRSRWPAFAAALLIAALFGLLSGVVRDVQFPRGVQSADRSGEPPHLSKREPLRALAATDRKDANGPHSLSADGALAPRSTDVPLPAYTTVFASKPAADRVASSFWPGPLPRAPPRRA